MSTHPDIHPDTGVGIRARWPCPAGRTSSSY